jgi:hypothetical protein
LRGGKLFSRLAEDIRDLVDDIEALLPPPDVQRLCEADISELDRSEPPLLRAADGEDRLLSDTIKKTIEPASNNYNVTFTGSNISGFQLGVNPGIIGNVSFGTARPS